MLNVELRPQLSAGSLEGSDAQALDTRGLPYTKNAYTFSKRVPRYDDHELKLLLIKIFHQLQLLFAASNRGPRSKTYVLNSVLQRAMLDMADEFNLTKSIHNILLENGRSEKRTYRVSDLRKFPEYAAILGYKDDQHHPPDKLIEFLVPRGWPPRYYLVEKPILPHDADMKLRNAKYILDSERFTPPEIKEALDQALYWEITEFRPTFAHRAQNAEPG